jgi:1-acyl-sn-glycerol-3-phosphate acyltransferase
MLLRWIVRRWIRAALWFRFRKIQIVYHEPPDQARGTILAANHQNSLLDTLTLAALSPTMPYTLSRASLFKNPMARRFLESLRFLPVYRFRDGFKGMRRNQDMFGRFADALVQNGWLLIFAEGLHYLGFGLKPLQKGAARIAFAAQEAQGWSREIPVVPVGLQYESHTAFGGRLLIQYGAPLSTVAFRSTHAQNPKEAQRALTHALAHDLRKLLVALPGAPPTEGEVPEEWKRTRGRRKDLLEQFEEDRALFDEEAVGAERPSLPPPTNPPWKRVAGRILALPGMVLHLPPLAFILAWEKLILRDHHFMPSARFVEGLLLVPLWWVAAGFLAYGLTGSWGRGQQEIPPSSWPQHRLRPTGKRGQEPAWLTRSLPNPRIRSSRRRIPTW